MNTETQIGKGSRKGAIILILIFLTIVLVTVIWRIYFAPIFVTSINASATSIRKPLNEIIKKNQVEQTFVSHFNNLARIDIMPGTYQRKNTCLLEVIIRDETVPDIVRKISVDAVKFPDTRFYSITFPPIQNSEHKLYTLIVRSPDGAPGNAVTLWYSPKTIYDEGQLKTNFQPVNGDLLFRTARQVNFSEWFKYVTYKMAGTKPSILGSPIFYSVLFILFPLILIIFVILFILYTF